MNRQQFSATRTTPFQGVPPGRRRPPRCFLLCHPATRRPTIFSSWPIAHPAVSWKRGWPCRAFGRTAKRGTLRASNASAATRGQRCLAAAAAGPAPGIAATAVGTPRTSAGRGPRRRASFPAGSEIARKYRGYCRSQSHGVLANESAVHQPGDLVAHVVDGVLPAGLCKGCRPRGAGCQPALQAAGRLLTCPTPRAGGWLPAHHGARLATCPTALNSSSARHA